LLPCVDEHGMVAFSLHLKAIVVQLQFDKLLFQNNWREFVCGVDWLLTCPIAALGHAGKCNQEVFRLLLGGLPCPSPPKVLRNAHNVFSFVTLAVPKVLGNAAGWSRHAGCRL